MNSAWRLTDSCTYHIKAECGAPGFVFDSSTTGTNSDAVLHYLEWDTAYPGFIENKDKADWPQYNSTTNVLDD